ncbi:MAG: hypothetical protein HQL08_00980 [Nitrospirae bacterium]|nr:hypothetical protein [Nitrospirota bacterium]
MGAKSVSSLNAAEIINNQVDALGEHICAWSANIGEYRLRGRSIKEWFLLPGHNVSTWWFSLLSEKNTLKTDAFLKIAQANAVKEVVKKGQYTDIVVAAADADLIKTLRNIAAAGKVRFKSLGTPPPGRLKPKIKHILNSCGFFGHMFWGILCWVSFIIRGCIERRGLGVRSQRLPNAPSLLFVSYFPAVEKAALNRKVFINKYASALQDKLKEMQISVTWLFMYVYLDGHSFRDAVRLAKTFAENGEKVFFVEEFLTLTDAITGFLLWLRQLVISLYLYPMAEKNCLLSGPVGNECAPIMKSLWNESFCGSVGMEGIMYSSIFRRVFGCIPHITDCLYYNEMHAWEKALNAAKRTEQKEIRTIGFQHSSVLKNWFNYFYDPGEIRNNNGPAALPLPDILACNGELTCASLSESGYPGLTRVEAVRYLYLNKVLSLPAMKPKETPVLLVAGSINKNETMALASLVNCAFPAAKAFQIWFKGHPSMPFEKVFKECGIDIDKAGYVIKHGSIEKCFKDAMAVLVGTSGVGIEALAYGREVIIPVFPNAMFMNPMADFKDYYHKVTSADDLAATIQRILDGHRLRSLEEYRAFFRKYWDTDSAIPKWTELFKQSAAYIKTGD